LGGDDGISFTLCWLFIRLGLRGGKDTGSDGNRSFSSIGGSGEGGFEDMAEGCRCFGSIAIRLSTRISSVCTEADRVDTNSCSETWQPTSLKYCGSRGSLGVAGLEVGG
jgi:hypothetical protein